MHYTINGPHPCPHLGVKVVRRPGKVIIYCRDCGELVTMLALTS